MSALAPCRHQAGALLLSLFLLIHSLPRLSSSQLQNADYSGKVNVKVSEILTRRPNSMDRSWPPGNSHEFAKININILGRSIDGTTFHNLRPDAANSDTRKLKKILGSEFQREWMSVEAPRHRGDPKDLPRSIPDMDIIRQVNQLNYTFVDSAGARVRLQPQYLNVWKTWLVQQATCPINYFWEDLGTLFWPRWVRRGHCVPTHRCSWPSGMRCRPADSKNLKLLQWKCNEDSPSQKKKRRAEFIRERWERRERRKRRKGRGRGRRRRRDRRQGSFARREGAEEKEIRKQRRIRRLIRKLSMTVNGYYCKWEMQKYVVNVRCSCMCQEG